MPVRRSLAFLLVAPPLALAAACGSSSSDGGAASPDASGADAGPPGDDGATLDAAAPDADASSPGDDAGTDASSGDAAPGDAGGATFAAVQATVLTGCSGFGPAKCHQRSPFGGDLDLTPGNAYAALVNVASTANSAVLRVQPGDADHSMLYRKLVNALAPDGGEGDPMPKGEAIQWSELPADQIQLVRDWITAGAPND